MYDPVVTLQTVHVPTVHEIQAAFLAVRPQVERHARFRFRHVRCPQTCEDAVAEAVALAWRWFRRLAESGKDPSRFVKRLARFACSHVRSGRRLCGQISTKDVLSPVAQARRGFVVLPLPARSAILGNEFDEALKHNTRSEVPEQVSFRLDFPRWRAKRSGRDRRVVDALMVGERPGAVARHHGLSASRVSQLRRELHDDWRAFHGESDAACSSSLA